MAQETFEREVMGTLTQISTDIGTMKIDISSLKTSAGKTERDIAELKLANKEVLQTVNDRNDAIANFAAPFAKPSAVSNPATIKL